MSRQTGPESPPNGDQFVLVHLPAPLSFIQLKEPLDDLEETAADTALLFWVVAVATFGFGDTVSSFLAFSAGASELNPIMDWALSMPGVLEGLLGFVLFKTVTMGALFSIAFLWEGPHRWLIPVLMTVAGVYLTTNNVMLYLDLA